MVEVNEVSPQRAPAEDPEADDSSSNPLPPDALDINVEGRQIAAPKDGFGQMWRKRYWVSLAGSDKTAAEIITTWRERYGEFWPEGNSFYRPAEGLKPGATALSDLEMPAGTRLSTGVIVVSVTDTSFTFRTPEGHTFAGFITFSAHDEPDGPVAQVEIVMRASDPLYEFAMPINGHKREDEFWKKTLQSLAEAFGADGTPHLESEVLDKRRQWRNAGNVVNNAYVRTTLYMITRPFRRIASAFKQGEATV